MNINDCETFGLQIERVSNGYIITYPPTEEGHMPRIEIIEDGKSIDDDESEAKSLSELLWDIKAYFLPQSKKAKHFVDINVEGVKE